LNAVNATMASSAISLPADASAVALSADPATSAPAAESPAVTTAAADALPVAPTPILATPIVAAPIEQPRPLKNSTVSVFQLAAEARHNEHMWIALAVTEHSAATFDAWTTRHAITADGAHELNPLLKPFAGNSSIYAAIQAGPLLMDYVGKKMMYSHNSWVRHMWWVPQSASIASSIFCGAHNLTVQ
jgi:hypothetical protein